ncbi:uncharacterized protein DFL_004515 [Arthrobotrys flagrans]|uniref:Uncharacterized protein n=1 Tax=Arthrobotrys flagrans TaxID=97331 RepID=A0A437A596_ARTFL|nr:hypothetical protein DFL_004515 [Arthrobotrys flagrans]
MHRPKTRESVSMDTAATTILLPQLEVVSPPKISLQLGVLKLGFEILNFKSWVGSSSRSAYVQTLVNVVGTIGCWGGTIDRERFTGSFMAYKVVVSCDSNFAIIALERLHIMGISHVVA